MNTMETVDNIQVNKHVAAVHCSNNISLLQRKIFNALLFKAYPQLLKEDFHYISLSELSTLIDYNSKDSAKLKQAFKKLQSTTVEWNVMEDDNDHEGEIWCSSTLLASTVIDKKRGQCRYEYSKTLASLLFQPDIYARIDLNIQNKFSSSYALALYENCVRYRNIKKTGWIPIDKFRKLMGVEAGYYTKFSDFNRRVLAVAIKEINALSDIIIDVELSRVAQQVISLRFSIENKRKTKVLGFKPVDDKPTHTRDLLLKEQFSASAQEIMSLTENYSSDYLDKKIQWVLNSESYKKGQVRVPLALLKSALKNDYMATEKTKPIENKKTKKLSWEQKIQYEFYRQKFVLEKFFILTEDEQTRFKTRFSNYLKNHDNLTYSKTVYTVYSTHGITAAAAEFVDFLISNSANFVVDIKSAEEFFMAKGV